MLRTYTPISHPINTLQKMLEHLVCEVWCKASDKNNCIELLEDDFKELYEHLDWLKTETDAIYEKSKSFTVDERKSVSEAFLSNNNIEELCNGTVKPVELVTLPEVIRIEVKSLFENFYKRLLDIKQVPGSKLDYYNELLKFNKYNTCPVCGLAIIETPESKYIEDYDHFFPKAHYPFAAVNFKNLVPTCDKCNKKHKGSNKPLDYNGKAYFPFETGRLPIEVTLKLNKVEYDGDEKLVENPSFSYTGDTDKNKTWNWLYNIDERYSAEIKRFSFSWLRRLKQEVAFNPDKTIEEHIDFNIANFKCDQFDELKFLKIALLKELKTKPEWMAVYH